MKEPTASQLAGHLTRKVVNGTIASVKGVAVAPVVAASLSAAVTVKGAQSAGRFFKRVVASSRQAANEFSEGYNA